VVIHRAYRHKVAFTPEQESLARRIAGCCRLIYTSGLEQRKSGAATDRGIDYKAHTYYLPEAKAAEGNRQRHPGRSVATRSTWTRTPRVAPGLNKRSSLYGIWRRESVRQS
jgi:hypothetical protein